MKIMVAYFARSGYTRRAAERLAQLLNAQLAPIEEPRSRRGPLGFLRSAIDAVRGRDAVIRPPVAEPAGMCDHRAYSSCIATT